MSAVPLLPGNIQDLLPQMLKGKPELSKLLFSFLVPLYSTLLLFIEISDEKK